jgi:hypothetical protein
VANAGRKKGKSGTKKYGRNEAKCKSYLVRGRREKNKKRRLVRHAEKCPNDMVAKEALERASKVPFGTKGRGQV